MSQKVMSAHYFSSIPDTVIFIYLFIYYLCEKNNNTKHMLSVFAMLT